MQRRGSRLWRIVNQVRNLGYADQTAAASMML